MPKLHQTLLAVNSFSLGILLPVLNLILLDSGATLQTLPLLMAIYSIAVFTFELPSGIFADLHGRKAVFLLSCGFNFISFTLFAISNNFIWLVIAIIFFGLGRAFASGSLDALFIDQAIEKKGEQCLAKVTSRMAVIEGAGLAAGGFAGGIISDITGSRTSNIIIRAAFSVLAFILCLLFIEEKVETKTQIRVPLSEHIKKGKEVIFSDTAFSFLFLGIFFVGFLLFALETYWQPAFLGLPNVQTSTWMLGLITFLCFSAVTIGNIVAQKLLDKYTEHHWKVYIIIRLIFAACILFYAVQKNAFGFIASFTITYLLLGTNNTAENTLINKFTPSRIRASVLSLSSLVSQAGALFASVFSSLMILRLDFSGIWITAGSLLGGCAIAAVLVVRKKQVSDLA